MTEKGYAPWREGQRGRAVFFLFDILSLIVLFLISHSAEATPSLSPTEIEEIKSKIEELENTVERLEGEMEITKVQTRMMIQRTNLSFLDQTYFRAGFTLLVPRTRTFSFRTDTGFGARLGVGHYFGRQSVMDLGTEWDIYPSLSLTYRFEFHSEDPNVTWGPLVGVRAKVFDLKPWDNFIENPTQLKSVFYFLGVTLGVPFGRSLFVFELLYMTNQQVFILTNAGIHLFFS